MGDILEVGDVEVDLGAREIRRLGKVIGVQPRVFDLFSYLIEHRERVVTKTELLECLWHGQTVVPDVLTTAFYALRRALDDDSKQPRYVRTVHRVGYRLVAEVSVRRAVGDSVVVPSAGRSTDRPLTPARAARHAVFVGREEEKALFEAMLGGGSKVQLLFLHGAPGIGKTSLVQELVLQCRARAVEHVWLSGATAGPFVDTFVPALAAALGCEGSLPRILDALAGCQLVIFVDDVHLLNGVDEWLRQQLWPELPSTIRVVLAGRRPPSARWRCDPAWGVAAYASELPGLTPEEARALFVARGASPRNSDLLCRRSLGHPLSLTLAAELAVDDAAVLDVLDHTDAIDTLVGWFTDRIGVESHQRAFELACLFETVSARALSYLDATTDDDIHWLENLSFAERMGDGVQIHALVRDAVIARLGRRDPGRLADLIECGCRYFIDAFRTAPDTATRLRSTHDFLGLGRHHPRLRALYLASDAVPQPTSTVQVAAPSELSHMIDMVARHEGAEAATIARRWSAHPATRIWSVRDDASSPSGFLMALRLMVHDRAAIAEIADPIVEAIFDFVTQAPDSRPDDEMIIHRTLIERDDYQRPSMASRYLHAVKTDNFVWHGTHSPTVAHFFSVYGEPDFWTPVTDSVGFVRLRDHEAVLGGRRFAPFHRRVRGIGVDAWFAEISRYLIGSVRALGTPIATDVPRA